MSYSLLTPSAPPNAAAVGYHTLTYGPGLKVGAFPGDPGNLWRFNFFGSDWTKQPITINPDGSVTMWQNGGNNYAAMLCSASFNKSIPSYYMNGNAFGGGGYFEAIMSFELDTAFGGATFWCNDIERMAGGSAGDPSAAQWPGQITGYVNAMEIDFAEFDAGMQSQQYGGFIHNFLGVNASVPQVGNGNLFNIGPVDFSDQHSYGFLWVPATATTKGSASWFFDNKPVGKVITWNLYNPSLPPPPIDPGSAYSVLDKRHMALILGNFGVNPVIVHAVSVWQASATGNLVR